MLDVQSPVVAMPEVSGREVSRPTDCQRGIFNSKYQGTLIGVITCVTTRLIRQPSLCPGQA